METDLKSTPYTLGNYGEFTEAFKALNPEERKETFKALVFRSFREEDESELKLLDPSEYEKAKKAVLKLQGIAWSQRLDCDGNEYDEIYRPLILNGN